MLERMEDAEEEIMKTGGCWGSWESRKEVEDEIGEARRGWKILGKVVGCWKG